MLDSFGFRNVIASQQVIQQPASQKLSPVPTRKVVEEPAYQQPIIKQQASVTLQQTQQINRNSIPQNI